MSIFLLHRRLDNYPAHQKKFYGTTEIAVESRYQGKTNKTPLNILW